MCANRVLIAYCICASPAAKGFEIIETIVREISRCMKCTGNGVRFGKLPDCSIYFSITLMRRNSSLFLVLTAIILCSSLTGCLFRRHAPEHTIATNVHLQQATLEQLVKNINAEADQIKTLNATVDIAASSGGPKKGKVTDFTEISGYILMRAPDMLRMLGDRKSTRLNSSHLVISYAVFCLKKKK